MKATPLKAVPKKRRRARVLSLDAEIRASAKQIYESGMAEAMRAAALMIVARKLDEVRTILGAVGINTNNVAGMVGGLPSNGVVQPVRQQQPAIEHPCVQCGREGVRKTRPNQWNRTGSWYCYDHQALAARSEVEDQVDNALIGPQAGPKLAPKPAIVQQAPAVMVPQAEAAPIVAAEPAGESSLDQAMAALGVS